MLRSTLGSHDSISAVCSTVTGVVEALVAGAAAAGFGAAVGCAAGAPEVGLGAAGACVGDDGAGVAAGAGLAPRPDTPRAVQPHPRGPRRLTIDAEGHRRVWRVANGFSIVSDSSPAGSGKGLREVLLNDGFQTRRRAD